MALNEYELVALLAFGLLFVLVMFVCVTLMKTLVLREQRRVLASMHATLAAIEENQRLVIAMRKAAKGDALMKDSMS